MTQYLVEMNLNIKENGVLLGHNKIKFIQYYTQALESEKHMVNPWFSSLVVGFRPNYLALFSKAAE